jgi:acyl-CoA synthetase (AMP-forming)/AMP-acid ligase II
VRLPGLVTEARSFAEVVRLRAEHDGARTALTFLGDGARVSAAWTNADLDRRARAIAARLQDTCAPGDRALLLFPPGLEYAAALIGCFYAGVIAVPAYPPDPMRLQRSLVRLLTIVDDARARVALTISAVRPMAESLFAAHPALAAMTWLAVDDSQPGDEAQYRESAACSDQLAFLQYTSGSTGSPRGVMLSHANLLANSAFIHRAFQTSAETHVVSWLPPYHDMGLIGGILHGLYVGFQSTLMSPLAFLERPLSWLRAVSRLRATCTGGPNFAFDLCTRRARAADLSALDLSSWSIAFCGAEPVRPATLDAFARTFGPCGFSRDALQPCYGLAEATLAVTVSSSGLGAQIQAFDAAGLTEHAVSERHADEDGATLLVGCGQPAADHEVVIVAPDSGERCGSERVGEIWVRGDSVARGYWQRPEETGRVFGARLSDGTGPYLRTGDLGFLRRGELFVTGRLKDLLIIQGRNFYPQDIEAVVEASHPAMRRNCGAAFTVDADGTGQLVIVSEVNTGQAPPWDEVVWAIRRNVAKQVDARVHAISLLRPRTIPKTSSGKIQRRQCQADFVSGGLSAVYHWSA